MEKEIKTVLKKTVKISCVTCLALGGAALVASGAAMKALTEGTKYVKDSVKKIIDEKPEDEPAEVVDTEVVSAEEKEIVEESATTEVTE